MKNIIALLSALVVFTALSGCDAGKEESSVLTTKTLEAETEEKFEPDKIYDYHDVSFAVDSEWEIDQIGTDNIHFNCTKSGGHIQLGFDKYNKDTCTKMFEHRLETYCDMPNASHRVIDSDDINISMINWQPTDGFETTYIFMYNDCIYELGFYSSDEHHDSCAMYKNSEIVINSLVFRNQQADEPAESAITESSGNKISEDIVQSKDVTTETKTEETTPQQNTTAMIDAISEDAKAAAANATPEKLQKSLDSLRTLSGSFYNSNETMYSTMYNAQVLYYYYEGTDTPYEQAGFYAFAAVKYVYRGIDDVDSPDTADNLAKFASALLQCEDIAPQSNDSIVVDASSPEEQGITVYVTPTGKKYHYDSNCNGGSYSSIDLDSALRRGLEPCKKCT